MAERLRVTGGHLSVAERSQRQRKIREDRVKSLQTNPATLQKAIQLESVDYLQTLENRSTVQLDGEPYNVAAHLPGPTQHNLERTLEVLADISRWRASARIQDYWIHVINKFAKGNMAANICIPFLMAQPRDAETDAVLPSFITNLVVLNDPDDCQRFARTHLTKTPDFQRNGLNHSIISTNDNEFWRQQREHFLEAFLPMGSLAKILPVTLKRAKDCGDRMLDLAKRNPQVDISDFMLHETQAQLQLALMGETEEFMNATNEKFRNQLNAKGDSPKFFFEFITKLTERMNERKDVTATAGESFESGCPVKGPLGKAMATLGGDFNTTFGNGVVFAFAGHDTTGHTLAWLLFELSKAPHLQQRLQKEVDTFVAKRHGNMEAVEYTDFKELPFMTRCIMETLRLWPAVANGTFRTLAFDDVCRGPDNTMVKLPKGTFVQVSNYARHRNPDLWGPDVNVFNPDRNFTEHELWDNSFKAYNPASKRFSPFTYNPRHCIGMNFAQMEMRAILVNVLHRCTFSLGDTSPDSVVALNTGTMGPSDDKAAAQCIHQSELTAGQVPVRPTGLHLHVQAR
eukprot:m.340615 g.340615  ORF g.340615 m.340615 type:complete len:571 (+) comp19415_c0_seq1:83-1795(+)